MMNGMPMCCCMCQESRVFISTKAIAWRAFNTAHCQILWTANSNRLKSDSFAV
jgi:hypothetical protein